MSGRFLTSDDVARVGGLVEKSDPEWNLFLSLMRDAHRVFGRIEGRLGLARSEESDPPVGPEISRSRTPTGNGLDHSCEEATTEPRTISTTEGLE